LATCTRPDISFAMARLARFVSAPTSAHWAAGKAVLRYLQGIKDLAIKYGRSSALVGYHDADYAADVDTRRSTTSAVFLLNRGAVAWTSKLQKSVAMSTTEAEYVAASMAAKEAIWLQRLLGELGNPQVAVKKHCHSQGAVAMMRNPMSSSRTKHIDVAHHFVREMVDAGKLTVVNVKTGDMTADVLTKALPMDGHHKFRGEMGLVAMTGNDSASPRVRVLAGVSTQDAAGGVEDKAPRGTGPQDGGASAVQDGGATAVQDGGVTAARDASGVAAGADGRAVTGGAPQAGIEEVNGANLAPCKGVKFGAQPQAADGIKAARGAAGKLENGCRR